MCYEKDKNNATNKKQDTIKENYMVIGMCFCVGIGATIKKDNNYNLKVIL